MIDIEDMRCFVAVVDSGGFSRAAARLGISKSMVSRRKSAIEDDLQTRLLSRTTRGISPTDAGLEFKSRSERIIAEFDEARAAVASLLGEAGVPPENVTFAPDQTGAPALQVTTYVALAPDCQAWSDIYSGWYQNSPTEALGCSNRRNLALMLADPRDLIQGRETVPADGQRMAGAVQRYRADKVKPFVKGNSTSAFILSPAMNGSQEDQ